jgi:hypothetical protein
MPRTIAKGPRGDSRRALERDRVSEALISSDRTSPGAATQALQLDHAIAVCSGTCLIGYVLDIRAGAIALDPDGREIGKYESRRLFAAVTETHLAEVRTP